ncbi:MAG: hypothetical protein U9Q74_13615 [Gemmatimonadota bacterium]|nr:hypothetical protein [Gemmatimonadota bacterium]
MAAIALLSRTLGGDRREKYGLPGGTIDAAEMPFDDNYFLVIERYM